MEVILVNVQQHVSLEDGSTTNLMDVKLPDGTVITAIISDESLRKVIALRWESEDKDSPSDVKDDEGVSVFGGEPVEEESDLSEVRPTYTVTKDDMGYPVFNGAKTAKTKIVLDEDGIPQL